MHFKRNDRYESKLRGYINNGYLYTGRILKTQDSRTALNDSEAAIWEKQ